LARRLEGTGVTANVLHPGFVATHIGQQNWLVHLLMKALYAFTAKSPEEGAQTSIYLASSPEVEGVSGKYFVDKEPVPSSPASYDRNAAQRLWAISEDMTGL
jgi:NAD(P)-dependent dehydrogenase (short-subunit alcohol dehydrogenase family)